MKKRTVQQASSVALKELGKPSSIKDIYNFIMLHDLYTFNTDAPKGIVKTSIRRHTVGLEFSDSRPEKHFILLKDGTYWLKDIPIPGQSQQEIQVELELQKDSKNLSRLFQELQSLQSQYTDAFKQQVLNQLKEIDPRSFEIFAKGLLKAFGFVNLAVTKKGRDGGIDGYGELKIGISYLRVSFQCKRYKDNSVSRKVVDEFRGVTQGRFEQGIIFTTSKFTAEALSSSIQPGAVPIVLVDGKVLVDIMIDKGFGIEIESTPLYRSAIDEVLNEDE